MELFKTIKEKHITAKQNDFHHQAEEVICLSDFGGDIYIAFNNVPIDLLDKSCTAQEMIDRLNTLRQNYVNAKMKNYAD